MATMGKHVYGDWKIIHKQHKYSRTASGKSWKSQPDIDTAEIVETDFYNRYVDSISFFNSWDGASCRGYRDYTFAGYVIVKITTVSPTRETKIVDTFEFMM